MSVHCSSSVDLTRNDSNLSEYNAHKCGEQKFRFRKLCVHLRWTKATVGKSIQLQHPISTVGTGGKGLGNQEYAGREPSHSPRSFNIDFTLFPPPGLMNSHQLLSCLSFCLTDFKSNRLWSNTFIILAPTQELISELDEQKYRWGKHR